MFIALLNYALANPNYRIRLVIETSLSAVDQDKIRIGDKSEKELLEEYLREVTRGQTLLRYDIVSEVKLEAGPRKNIIAEIEPLPEKFAYLPPIIDSANFNKYRSIIEESVKAGRILLIVVPRDIADYLPFIFKIPYHVDKTDVDKVIHNLRVIGSILALVHQVVNIVELPTEIRDRLAKLLDGVCTCYEDIAREFPQASQQPIASRYFKYVYNVSMKGNLYVLELRLEEPHSRNVVIATCYTGNASELHELDVKIREHVKRLRAKFSVAGVDMLLLCDEQECEKKLADVFRELGCTVEIKSSTGSTLHSL